MHSDAAPAAPSPPRRSWRPGRRLWLGVLVVLIALAAAAKLAIVYGPPLVARQVVRTYLDGLNIDTSGVETLRIRPLQGELSFGPVTFRGADAQMGEVGRIGVSIDVTRLLRRQALVRSIVIEGVRFEVRQAADGSFSLNGIPLDQLLAGRTQSDSGEGPPAEGKAGPTPPAEMSPREMREKLGWGAGLELLEIRDSRVAFVDARGGEAVMHVHRLELGDFSTWAPDHPGYYRLDAELNNIGLTASGNAKPFADKIEVEAEAAVSGIEVSKIERYLGPLGFTSRAGRIDLAVQRAWIGVFAAGRLEMRLAATGTMTGVDLAHPLFGSGRLATGTLRLDDVSAAYDAARQTTVTGDLGIDLQASALRLGDRGEARFSRASLVLPGTMVRSTPGLQPEVRVAPQLDVEGLRLSGANLRGGIDSIAVRLSGFSIEGAQPGAPFFVTGSVAAERIDLLLPEVEPIAIVADRVQLDLAETRLAFPPGQGAQIAGGLALDTRQLSVSVQQAASAGRKQQPPPRIDARRLAFAMPTLAYDDTGEGGMSVTVREPELSVDGLRLDGPAVRGSIDRAALRFSNVGVAGSGAPLTANGRLTMDRVDLRIPDAEPVTIAAGHLQADLVEASVPLTPGPARLTGGLALDMHDLLVTLQELGHGGLPPPPATSIEAARIKAVVPAVTGERRDAPAGTVGIARPSVSVDRLRLGGADIQGTVRSADIRLDDIGIETEAPGPPVVATGKVVARDLDLLIPDADPIGIAARAFDAELTRARFAFPSRQSLIEGAFGVDTKDLDVRLYEQPKQGQPAPPPMRIGAARFAGKLSRLLVDERRKTSLRINVATPALSLDQFRLETAAGATGVLRLASSSLTLRRADVDVNQGATLGVAVQAGAMAPDLSLVMVPQSGPAGAQGQITGLDLDLNRFAFRREGKMNGLGLQGRIGVQAMQGRLPPQGPGEPADRLTLEGLKLDIADADLAEGDGKPAWRARLDLALKSLAATLRQPLPLTATIDDVSLGGLAVASGEGYAADRLTVGRMDASLARETLPKPRPAKPQAPAAQTWPPADLPPVRIGRLALLNGGRIVWRDTAFTPSVNTTLAMDTLSLENLDTTDPAARTRMRVAGRLDDAALGIDGWAEAFRAEPSFALRARLDDLQLPIVSPYLGPPLGLEFRRGTLSLGADAEATAGQLDGSIRARMVGVRVADRRDAGTAEFVRSIGVPLSTLFRLMEDGDGAIDVTLPVQGDLASPEVSYTGAVWSLLPRVLRAFVVSPVRFVSSATSLAAAVRERQAAPAEASPDVSAAATRTPQALAGSGP